MSRPALAVFRTAAFLSAMLAFASGPSPAQQFAGDVSLATRANPMTVIVDARDAGQGIMYAHLTIPVRPGPFRLVYPKWIPGEHSASGPLGDLVFLKMAANGQPLEWHRDPVDLYAFAVQVPPGVSSLAVDFDMLLNGNGERMSTPQIAIVNWNRALLYQAGAHASDVSVKASMLLPAGWDFGTALPGARRSGDRVDFDVASLETVVDSPLDMGRFAKHVRLYEREDASVDLDIFADLPQDLPASPSVFAGYRRMVTEALAAYGARHWQHYHALLTLSDAIGYEGIEHHQSSDNRAPDDFLTEPDRQATGGSLITHEFSHSWNGKYRRPADLATPDYQVAEQTDLLWVYEGLNEYLGDLFAFRAGIREAKMYPEYLATVYARLDAEPGRLRTPLIDLTTGAPYLYGTGGEYSSLRRTAGDFYDEGELLWLDVDTIVREQTHGAKSLDDFLAAFAGPPDTSPLVRTYTRADVEALLGNVAPYDWHAFFERYVYHVSVHPPADELERAGWRLSYSDKPNDYTVVRDRISKTSGAWYSLGLTLDEKAVVRDVRAGSPAFDAGIEPGSTVLAVDGQKYAQKALDEAIETAASSERPIVMLTQNGSWFTEHNVVYKDGLRFPHLVRIPGSTDMLSAIMAPHAK